MRAFPAQHGLRQRRLHNLGLRTTVGALFAFLLAFRQPLQVLVDADRQELDDGVLHAQAAFEFLHNRGLGGELHQHEVAFAVLFNAVGQLALAPLVDFVDHAACGDDLLGHCLDQKIDVLFRCIGFHDEQILVDSLH